MAKPTSLENLPTEILNHVLELLPKDALANLRLASTYYQPRAREHLYRHLSLYDSVRYSARAGKIIQQQSLARLVREVTLQASCSERVWNDHDHGRCLRDIRKLTRLRSLSIRFHPVMLRARLVHNSGFFANIFSALMVSHFISCGLDRLSITDLQSRDEPFVTTSLGFLQLVRNIRTLELVIWTIEYDKLSIFSKKPVETVTFYLQLPQTWLAPASPNLRVLHLSADIPWGWYPKVDFHSIYFPHLRDLTLVRFTFSHDWHLQWFSDHATSLQHLKLVGCSILDHAASTGQHFDSEGYPLGVEPFGDDTEVKGSHSHKKRWSHYFNAIKNTLPQLLSFSSMHPDRRLRLTHLQNVHEVEISAVRYAYHYLKYRSNSSYTPLFGNKFGTLDEFERYKMCGGDKQAQRAEDEQALRALFTMIQRRSGIRV